LTPPLLEADVLVEGEVIVALASAGPDGGDVVTVEFPAVDDEVAPGEVPGGTGGLA
jgi:hypothetical protein